MKQSNFMRLGAWMLALGLVGTLTFSSCKEEEPAPPPPGDVTADFTSAAEGLTVTLTDLSVNATEWAWDFGDGSGTSTDQSPVYTYTTPGTYDVKLIASNSADSDEITKTVITQNGGALASKIVDKTWIPAHGAVWCYAQGGSDADHGMTWDDQTPVNFGWGDVVGGWVNLKDRPSLANDEYVFNLDGTMSTDFNGDFWLEFSMWDSEGNHDLADPLPNGVNGDPMNDFSNPNDAWTFAIDEDNSKFIVNGSGAHIMNPRLAYGGPSDGPVLKPQSSVNYDIIRVVEVDGAADTLVLYAATTLDFGHYITMHSYENESDIPDWYAPCEIVREGTVNAADYAHTFASEDGSTAMASINVDYVPTWGADDPAGGMDKCTKFQIYNEEGHNVWGNLLMRGGSKGTCEEGTEKNVNAIVFDAVNPEYHVKFDIYIPAAENDFSTDLQNILWVRFADEAQLGGNFWQKYVQQNKVDLATDTWVSVDFDFNQDGVDGNNLATEISSENMVPDLMQIDWGGDNHSASGTFYIKNLRLEAN
jgi:PKD repeat protein